MWRLAVLLYLIGGFPGLTLALPQDPEIQSGSFEFKLASPKRLNIIQGTNTGIINWKSFSNRDQEHIHFQLPSANSRVLNRVLGDNVSNILGRLTSNGNIFLVNPNGVVFGKNSKVIIGGTFIETLDH